MWRRLKDNLDNGVKKIKWVSSVFSDRLKIEYSLMKLLYQSEQMERKKDELMKKIGERVCELKGYSDRYILKDRVIMEALHEIEKLSSEIDETKKKASEMSKIEE
ncbi:MAG: hypothetical protein FJ241_01745 [Nitrospira sp.]|nr:hypothetical protein [Nitrospira sp.]